MKHAALSAPALLAGLRARDRLAYEFVYRVARPDVLRYVRQNHGDAADGEDLFQEALLAVTAHVQRPDFQLTSSFRTYLLVIARNLWLNQLRTRRRQALTCDATDLPDLPDEPAADESSLLGRVRGWLDQASPLCRRVLRALYFDDEPMDELMPRMGWKNKHTAANQKYKCVQQLKRVAAA
ncbi:MAG: RNA polymerase sigma factor [Janthinobacterium lividum]